MPGGFRASFFEKRFDYRPALRSASISSFRASTDTFTEEEVSSLIF